MTFKKPAAIALATLLLLPVPAWSFESNDTSTSTMFYVSIPLDRGGTGKDPGPTFGLQLQGKREHQVVRLDTRMMRFAGLGVDDRAVAAGGAALLLLMMTARKDKSTTSSLQTQQQEHQRIVESGGGGCTKPKEPDPC